MIEYLLGMTVIMLVVLYAARRNGPLHSGLNAIFSGIQGVLTNAVTESSKKFK